MSFGFLPVPVYIAIVLFCLVVLFSYSAKYYNKENRVLSAGFFLIALGAVCLITAKSIEEYFRNYEQFVSILVIVMSILMIIGFSLIIIARWKYVMKDPQRKKLLITGFVIIGVSILGVAAIIMTHRR